MCVRERETERERGREINGNISYSTVSVFKRESWREIDRIEYIVMGRERRER